jgi:hypothetical protein
MIVLVVKTGWFSEDTYPAGYELVCFGNVLQIRAYSGKIVAVYRATAYKKAYYRD